MKKAISWIILLLVIVAANGQIPEKPTPPRLVNDLADVLAHDEEQRLENQLVHFARNTSTQIVVVTVNDLQGYDPSDFAFQIGEKWGVGQSQDNNGIVVLVKPKRGDDRGQVFVATGYGLEGVLPDAIVNREIVDNEMIPYFRQNDYYKGLESGLNVIMDITRGEYTAEYYAENYAGKTGSIIPFLFFIILFFIIMPILSGRRRRFYSPGKSLPFWLALGMLSGSGRSHGGSFSNFSSGSGGFGGFGGGSFGGGGAGGSW